MTRQKKITVVISTLIVAMISTIISLLIIENTINCSHYVGYALIALAVLCLLPTILCAGNALRDNSYRSLPDSFEEDVTSRTSDLTQSTYTQVMETKALMDTFSPKIKDIDQNSIVINKNIILLDKKIEVVNKLTSETNSKLIDNDTRVLLLTGKIDSLIDQVNKLNPPKAQSQPIKATVVSKTKGI